MQLLAIGRQKNITSIFNVSQTIEWFIKFLLQKNLLEQNTTSHGLIDFENSPVNHYQNQAEL